jgi:hypothetical protein
MFLATACRNLHSQFKKGFKAQPHALVFEDKFKDLLMHVIKPYRGVELEVQSL